MKIGIDCRAVSQYTDGIGKYSIRLIEHLGKIDKNNDYILFFYNEYYGKKACPPNFTSVMVPYRHLTIRSLFQMGSLVNKYNLDVFHSLFFIMPYGIKCKKIITVPDLMALKISNFFSNRPWLFETYAKYYHKIFVPSSIKRSERVITISNATLNDIKKMVGIPENIMSTIYLGVDDVFYRRDQDQIQEISIKYKLPDRYMLYTGNTKPYKNIPGLLKSFMLYKEKGGKCKLVMVSFKDRFKNVIADNIDELNLKNDVLILDKIDNADLPKIMSKAEMFVFVSLHEGFGLPPLEAMSCGCPAVVSSIPALSEIAGDGAIKIDPYDHKGIAEALLQLESDPEIRKHYSDKGIARAKNYNWVKCARETLQIYESMK